MCSQIKPVCGLCPTSLSLLGVCDYINNSATLTVTSSFGVCMLLYVCVLPKKKKAITQKRCDRQIDIVYVKKEKRKTCAWPLSHPSLLGVHEYINSFATLTAASSFRVGVLLYVYMFSNKTCVWALSHIA